MHHAGALACSLDSQSLLRLEAVSVVINTIWLRIHVTRVCVDPADNHAFQGRHREHMYTDVATEDLIHSGTATQHCTVTSLYSCHGIAVGLQHTVLLSWHCMSRFVREQITC